MKVNIKYKAFAALSLGFSLSGAAWCSSGASAQPPAAAPSTGEMPTAPGSPVPPESAALVQAPALIALPAVVRPEQGDGGEVRVLLQVTIDAAGAVTAAEVRESAGAAFDAAALDAVQRGSFSPARRDGVAIAARILFAYVFPAVVAETAVPAPADGLPTDAPPEIDGSAGQALAEPPAASAEAEDGSGAEAQVFGASAVVRSLADERRHSVEAVDVVDLADAQSRTADLGEVLARAEGVTVRRSGGLGSQERISLGGLEGRQIRYFLDGIPLRYAGFATGLANIPVGLVDRVEIYRGVVPIRYGADAVGGAIDLVSDPATSGHGGTVSYQTGAFETHRFAASGRVQHARTGLFARALAYFDAARNNYDVDVEVANASGRREPRTVTLGNADYRAYGVALDVGAAGRPRARLATLRGFATEHERGIPHNLGMTVPYGDVHYGQADRGLLLRYENDFLRDRLTLAVAAGFVVHRVRFEDQGACRYTWLGQCVRALDPVGEMMAGGRNLETVERSTYLRANLSFRPSETHALHVSLSPEVDLRDTARDSVAVSTLTGRGTRRMFVAGAAYDLRLSQRFENSAFVKLYSQRLTADEHVFGEVQTHDVSKRAFGVGDSLRFVLTEHLSLKASYEWATRMPAPDEYFGDGTLTLYNYALGPERSHNVNLALRAQVRSERLGRFEGEVALFARVVNDLIWHTASADTFLFENIGEARSLGVTANLSYRSPGDWVALRGTTSYLDARNVSSAGAYADVRGDRLPNRPFLEAAGEVELGLDGLVRDRDRLTVLCGFRYTHEFFLAYESRGTAGSQLTIPSQLVMHAALRYVVAYGPRTLSTVIEAQNLTDTVVYDFFGVQRPRRGVYAKLTVDF